jgi:F-type H+-transporting ATPase subunit a
MNLLLANAIDHIASRELFTLGPVVFTNHMLMITVATLLLMIIIPLAVGKVVMVPKGFGNAIESVCVYIREEVARPFLHEDTDKYIGYLWSLFFFILTLNILGMVPTDKIIWVFTHKENHLQGTATANIWVTGALALFSFLLFHIAGIVEQGPINYIKNFAPKVPWPILPFIFFMEIVSSFVRMFSLAVRLFANMLAGHILLGTVFAFIFMFKNYAVAFSSVTFFVVMSLMEVFIAFLQAYIFVFLTTIFIGFAVNPDH